MCYTCRVVIRSCTYIDKYNSGPATNYKQTTTGDRGRTTWRQEREGAKKIVCDRQTVRIYEPTSPPSTHQGPAAQIYKENGVGAWKKEKDETG